MTASAQNSWILGVNLSGAEFGNAATGRMFWDYIYPTASELDHYASDGARVVRIPISLERLQPVANGSLDATQLAALDAVVQRANSDGMKVIIDPHNYGYIFGSEIGSTPASNVAFADFWSKLASHYATNDKVIFGLMNEPHVQTPTEWLTSANTAIAAIRGAGALTQEILVPGTAWDTAATWVQSGNAATFANGVLDPQNNYAFEVHQYFDADNSGSHSTVVSATIGAERLEAVTAWAQSTGHKLFLGEFGAASDSMSLEALSNTLTYMQSHPDVWQGGTYWAGGPWMSGYMFSPESATGSDTVQMTTLRKFMKLPNEDAPVQNVVVPIAAAPIVTVPVGALSPASTVATQGDPTPAKIVQGGGPSSDGAVYRFFDNVSGTQFLTSSSAERNAIIATRPDLVSEGVGIGAVSSPTDDPNASAVYRFFDTQSGTHFYTSSLTEQTDIQTTRSDLVYEGVSFYEHQTAAAGDTAVYRFFNTNNGTHFFTGSQSERSAILVGRPDLVSEGVAFYAPTI